MAKAPSGARAAHRLNLEARRHGHNVGYHHRKKARCVTFEKVHSFKNSWSDFQRHGGGDGAWTCRVNDPAGREGLRNGGDAFEPDESARGAGVEVRVRRRGPSRVRFVLKRATTAEAPRTKKKPRKT